MEEIQIVPGHINTKLGVNTKLGGNAMLIYQEIEQTSGITTEKMSRTQRKSLLT